jgi:hypothetical protein
VQKPLKGFIFAVTLPVIIYIELQTSTSILRYKNNYLKTIRKSSEINQPYLHPPYPCLTMFVPVPVDLTSSTL